MHEHTARKINPFCIMALLLVLTVSLKVVSLKAINFFIIAYLLVSIVFYEQAKDLDHLTYTLF